MYHIDSNLGSKYIAYACGWSLWRPFSLNLAICKVSEIGVRQNFLKNREEFFRNLDVNKTY